MREGDNATFPPAYALVQVDVCLHIAGPALYGTLLVEFSCEPRVYLGMEKEAGSSTA